MSKQKSQNDSEMFVSIIIPVYNAEKYIERTVTSLLLQDFSRSQYEIIAVNDGSNDNTSQILKNFSNRIVYLQQENSGPAAARNTGAKAARGDILVFTDSDTIPENDWLSKITDSFTDSNVCACSGTYSNANPDFLLSRIIQEELNLRYARFKEFIKFAGTYNLAVRKQLFIRSGGFNESYVQASGEDNDFCYKLNKIGKLIRFVPEAKVAHFHTFQLRKYLKEQCRHGYWRAKLYATHPSKLAGDDYTYWKDMIEPPLCLLCFSALPVFLSRKQGLKRVAALTLAALLTTLAAIEILQVYKFNLNRQSRLFAALVMFLRAFARTFGFIHGALNFYGKAANDK